MTVLVRSAFEAAYSTISCLLQFTYLLILFKAGEQVNRQRLPSNCRVIGYSVIDVATTERCVES